MYNTEIIRELISKSKTREAISLLISMKENVDQLDQKIIVLINSFYSEVERKVLLGLIKEDESQISFNKINSYILDFSIASNKSEKRIVLQKLLNEGKILYKKSKGFLVASGVFFSFAISIFLIGLFDEDPNAEMFISSFFFSISIITSLFSIYMKEQDFYLSKIILFSSVLIFCVSRFVEIDYEKSRKNNYFDSGLSESEYWDSISTRNDLIDASIRSNIYIKEISNLKRNEFSLKIEGVIVNNSNRTVDVTIHLSFYNKFGETIDSHDLTEYDIRPEDSKYFYYYNSDDFALNHFKTYKYEITTINF